MYGDDSKTGHVIFIIKAKWCSWESICFLLECLQRKFIYSRSKRADGTYFFEKFFIQWGISLLMIILSSERMFPSVSAFQVSNLNVIECFMCDFDSLLTRKRTISDGKNF